MAEEKCEPRFYLSSLDPGVGKTQTVIQFLKTLLASPQHDEVGVVIFFYTKQQIEEVVTQAGLNKADYAVLMSPQEESEQALIDSGSANHNRARVLFTTQQRLQLVCRDRDFAAADQYYFLGVPRHVRIWDEALLPATETIVRVYDIPGLIPAVARLSEEMVGDLDELRERVHAAADRDVLLVPDLATKYNLSLRRLLAQGRGLSAEAPRIATDLWSLFGTQASIRSDGKRGPAMVSFRQSVPHDLTPIVVLDASGRVRTAYDWWDRHGDTLVRLTAARKRYDNLTVHVWDTGGGQSSFDNEKARYWRSDGIARTINGKPNEPWLVICHKAHRDDIEKHIRRELKGDPERIGFLHWGIHRASNDFRDVPNIILAGTQFLPPSSYEGIGRAARGLLPADGPITDEMQREIELGELSDRVLQAACRGLVRKAVEDRCPTCDAYIIARRASGLHERFADIFPDCLIEAWEPAPPRLKGNPEKAFLFIQRWFADTYRDLTVKQVMDAIGETSRANFNKNIRKHAGFKLALEQEGIYEFYIGRTCAGFREVVEYEPVSAEVFRDEVAAVRRQLLGLIQERGLRLARKRLLELVQARRKAIGEQPKPLDRATARRLFLQTRIGDLRPDDVVRIECGRCWHTAKLTAKRLAAMGLSADRKVSDLALRMPCGKCNVRGIAKVAIITPEGVLSA